MDVRYMKNLVFLFFIVITSCTTTQDKTQFSEKALADVMLDIQGEKITFSKIIEQYKGRKVVIDIWASWCSDCIEGMPKVKDLQKENSDTVFLFLSLDKDFASWKRGIEKYQVEGEHYFVYDGWDSDFNKFIDLDWIPRYIVVGADGKIQLFKATKASDEKLEIAIKNSY
ncbi:TlpA disulfide reductase family protein [Flavicella sp.]|uniref:TlpA family protein disulfide reductase n=1 Tax=Flavicella sp. TaxID=2957742 RepID=UPI0030190A72